LAETTVLCDFQPADKGSLLSLNIAISLARQTRRKVLLIELAQDSSLAIPFTPELGGLVDILEDRTLLDRHEAPVARDNGLGGLRVVGLTSPHARDFQPADALAALALIEPIYDHTIFHLPSGDHMLSRSILERAQLIFVLLPYQGVSQASRQLAFLHSVPNAAQKASFVVTGGPPQTKVNAMQELQAQLGWKIERILPEDATFTQTLGGSPFVLAKPSATLSREIDRLSRHIGRLSVGLALGAGGSKGLAHVGVLKVLEEEDVPIDYISGCSFGAVVGALCAMGYDSAEMSKIGLPILAPTGVKSLLRFGFSRLSLLSGKGMERLLRKAVGQEQFDSLRIPFAAVSVDLNTGSEIVLKDGALYPAVRGSASMPGIFPPLKLEELLLVDGGVLNPVPVRTVAALGANVVIGVDVSNPQPLPEWPDEPAKVGRDKQGILYRDAVSILYRVWDIALGDICKRSGQDAEVLITPRFGPCSWRDFHRAGQFFTAGEQAAREALPQLRTVLPWLMP